MTDKTLMDMIIGKDYDVTQLFQEEWQPPKSPIERDKRRGGRLETEEFYLSVSASFYMWIDALICLLILLCYCATFSYRYIILFILPAVRVISFVNVTLLNGLLRMFF